jgi:ATP-dependent DNA helicase RecG
MIPWPEHPAFTRSIGDLPGIGRIRLQALKAKGIIVYKDLLLIPPVSYQDRRQMLSLAQASNASEGADILFKGTIARLKMDPLGRYLLAEMIEGPYKCSLWWFGGLSYFESYLKANPNLIVFAQAKFRDGRLNLSHPDISPDNPGNPQTMGVIPVYDPKGPIPAATRRQVMAKILDQLPYAPKIMDEDFLKRFKLQDPTQLLSVIHRPPSDKPGFIPKPKNSRAWRTLTTYELMFWRLIILSAKPPKETLTNRRPDSVMLEAVDTIWQSLPFKASSEQLRVTEEILTDLSDSAPMNRLLQGEVGCGKTAVAAAACAAALACGRQAAIMAPTEILANQHLMFFSSLAPKLGFEVLALTGRTPAAERRRVLKIMASDQPSITIGTQALISEAALFGNLGLAIIDEQHRFGVKQRLTLRAKSPGVNLLSLSATPIPGSLAGILYGDTDLSSMRGVLPGRSRPQTISYEFTEISKARRFFIDHLRQGGLGFLICPRIGSEGDHNNFDLDGPLEDISETFDPYQSPDDDPSSQKSDLRPDLLSSAKAVRDLAPDLSMGILHGRLDPATRSQVMEDFRLGELKILAATTMVEVGVDVPAADIMLVEGAEYFGLAQLHQLRGRVGRGGGKAYFLVVPSGPGTEITRARLKALQGDHDGYALAELDLKLRGPGEELGLRQSGWPKFNFAKLPADVGLLSDAMTWANYLWDKKEMWTYGFKRSLKEAGDQLAQASESPKSAQSPRTSRQSPKDRQSPKINQAPHNTQIPKRPVGRPRKQPPK